MQYDILRAFPYPVLRPGNDDYGDAEIQTVVELRPENGQDQIVASIRMDLSVPELTELVELGKASYSVVLSCRDTYLRRALSSQQSDFSSALNSGELRGEVIVSPYIVAKERIEEFRCESINVEFGSETFTFEKGSVLALDQPQVVYVDRESFKPISSSFVLVKDDNLANFDWRIEASYDKVRIATSTHLKHNIDAARNSKQNQAILLNSLYFSAVMQCLSFLKQSEDYDTYRWAGIFRQRLSDLNIDLKSSPESEIAQKLLQNPVSLIDTYFLKGNET